MDAQELLKQANWDAYTAQILIKYWGKQIPKVVKTHLLQKAEAPTKVTNVSDFMIAKT